MFKNIFSIKLLILILLFVFCFSLSSCGGDTSKTYLDGTYMNDKLNVGYIFFPDGTGHQFILQDHFLIEYELSDGTITITTLIEGSKLSNTFPFEKSGEDIVIDGIPYMVVPEDTSGFYDTTS